MHIFPLICKQYSKRQNNKKNKVDYYYLPVVQVDEVDDSAGVCGLEGGVEEVGQQEGAHVVHPQLCLKSVFCQHFAAFHNSRIVDQNIKFRLFHHKILGKLSYRTE